jgi:pimeloyl-ACP methyl ester carboxylesterase
VRHWEGDLQLPLTVLLHGFLDTGETWQFLVDEWPGAQRCCAPDWRGFGRSAGTGAPYWFPQYFADLDELLEHLSPGVAVNLVGHSMGGHIALTYAGLRPERVKRVISLDGPGLARTEPADAVQKYRRWLDQLQEPLPHFGDYPSLEVFAQVLRKRQPRLTPARAAFVAQAWTRPLAEGRVALAMDPWHKLINPVNYRRDEQEACWAQICAPTLLLQAELGEYRSELGEDGTDAGLRRAFPKAQFAELPGVSHMLHHQRPAAVAAWVAAFLEGRPLPDVTGME